MALPAKAVLAFIIQKIKKRLRAKDFRLKVTLIFPVYLLFLNPDFNIFSLLKKICVIIICIIKLNKKSRQKFCFLILFQEQASGGPTDMVNSVKCYVLGAFALFTQHLTLYSNHCFFSLVALRPCLSAGLL